MSPGREQPTRCEARLLLLENTSQHPPNVSIITNVTEAKLRPSVDMSTTKACPAEPRLHLRHPRKSDLSELRSRSARNRVNPISEVHPLRDKLLRRRWVAGSSPAITKRKR